jgi:condensin complex subunit 1
MLKLKGEVVDICMLLDSNDTSIKNHVNLFFQEINSKGNNVIYNIIPKALARLSSEYHNLPYEKFQNIARTLLKYVDKEKHIEGLVDKLFVKLKNSNELIEWRNTTYVLSLLNYNNEKIMMKFLENYAEIKDKSDDDNDIKFNLGEVFIKYNKIQNLNQNFKETLENAEKK